jgi:Tfp pilus assembly protein PilX
MNNEIRYNRLNSKYQSGIITTFTGVLILVLLTLMMFFAIRVGVFEQRVSSNEMRQKLAFHAAESGLHHAKEFLRDNSVLIASPIADLLPNGTDGWLANTAEKRWLKCSDAAGLDLATGSGTHPCFGESVATVRPNTYFYSFAGSTILPVDTNAVVPGTS